MLKNISYFSHNLCIYKPENLRTEHVSVFIRRPVANPINFRITGALVEVLLKTWFLHNARSTFQFQLVTDVCRRFFYTRESDGENFPRYTLSRVCDVDFNCSIDLFAIRLGENSKLKSIWKSHLQTKTSDRSQKIVFMKWEV